MQQNIGHALCSCGHVKGCHARGQSLCQLRGCSCDRFTLDSYIPEVTPQSIGQRSTIDIKVAGDWI